MLLRGFQITKGFSCVMGTWLLPSASGRRQMYISTERPSHRQLPASWSARLGDISGRHLSPGKMFWEGFPCRTLLLQPAESPVSCGEAESQDPAQQALGCGDCTTSPTIKSKSVLKAKALTGTFCVETSGA